MCSGTRLQRRLFLMLQSCRSMQHLSVVHSQIILNGFSQKSSLLHKLLSCCIACGDLGYASRAFEQAENPSTTVWNQMIMGFSKSSMPEQSILLYNRLMGGVAEEGEAASARPNGFTYSFLLGACSRPSRLQEGEQLHGRIMLSGFLFSVFVQTRLINMYAASAGEDDNAIQRARMLFDEMPQRNLATWNCMLAWYLRNGNTASGLRLFDDMPEKDVVSWTTMIAGSAQIGRSKQALALFHRMQMSGVDADQVTMVATLSACADLGDLELGRRIHSCLDGKATTVNKRYGQPGYHRLVSLDNSLINMYVKCGDVDEAYSLFQKVAKRDTVSWTIMIMGFVMHDRCEDALDIFQQMQLRAKWNGGERPDKVTFIGVLCACSHMGRLEEGWRYFRYMTQTCHINPRIEHYGCMVDMLSRAGLLDEARELIEQDMPMEPNDVIWGALLGGCKIHGDLKSAGHAACRLLELNPPNPRLAGHLVHVCNLYAVAGKWDDALRFRKKMVDVGVRKPAGRCWVLVHGVVHEFMAGDQTGQCDPAVYRMVGEIIERAKLAGHMPDTSQVLLDVEEEEREPFLSHHSEKLALAFGLVSIRDTRIPIRIVANLRMCSDCHSIAEFVSGSFGREVIIRERNRFHHFSRGACSCRHI